MIIFVSNLSSDCTEETLTRVFQVYGQVLSVSIMDDKYIGSGQPRVYGYVEMASKSEGSAAVDGLLGKVVNDRKLQIVEALPLEKKTAGVFTKRPNKKIRQRT